MQATSPPTSRLFHGSCSPHHARHALAARSDGALTIAPAVAAARCAACAGHLRAPGAYPALRAGRLAHEARAPPSCTRATCPDTTWAPARVANASWGSLVGVSRRAGGRRPRHEGVRPRPLARRAASPQRGLGRWLLGGSAPGTSVGARSGGGARERLKVRSEGRPECRLEVRCTLEVLIIDPIYS